MHISIQTPRPAPLPAWSPAPKRPRRPRSVALSPKEGRLLRRSIGDKIAAALAVAGEPDLEFWSLRWRMAGGSSLRVLSGEAVLLAGRLFDEAGRADTGAERRALLVLARRWQRRASR